VIASHPDIIQVNKLNQSHVLKPGEKKDIFAFQVLQKSELCEASGNVEITIKSNITNLKLPVTCYDGKLSMVFPLLIYYIL